MALELDEWAAEWRVGATRSVAFGGLDVMWEEMMPLVAGYRAGSCGMATRRITHEKMTAMAIGNCQMGRERAFEARLFCERLRCLEEVSYCKRRESGAECFALAASELLFQLM